ncbi:MAG: hypothetical protein ABIP61_13345 [Burkholderiaceae bacterium]
MFDNHPRIVSASFDDVSIQPNSAAPPMAIPPGHIGEIMLPGTGRLIWWTGRVAIGLRHEPPQRFDATTESALWLQELMLRPAARPVLA